MAAAPTFSMDTVSKSKLSATTAHHNGFNLEGAIEICHEPSLNGRQSPSTEVTSNVHQKVAIDELQDLRST